MTLEISPLTIEESPIIVTPWNVGIGRSREQILSISVWAIFSLIPSVLQPLIGLNWLASLIGEFKCFDANTIAHKNLFYARALIEISPLKLLPSVLKVRIIEGHEMEISVNYSWKLGMCSNCQSFGYIAVKCLRNSPLSLVDRTPLSRMETKWVPNIGSLPIPVCAVLVSPSVESDSASVACDSDDEIIY